MNNVLLLLQLLASPEVTIFVVPVVVTTVARVSAADWGVAVPLAGIFLLLLIAFS